MTMTRDEAEGKLGNLIDAAYRIHDCQFNEQRDEQIALIEGLKQELLTALTTNTEMYEGEPKEEWRKNEEKIEECMKDLEKLASTNMLPFDTGCTRSILTKHFGGKP